MTTATVAPLPPYPSSQARSKLSPSQLAQLNQKVALSIQQTLQLPVQALNTVAAAAFISSYARDLAQNALDALIWDVDSQPKPKLESIEARTIRSCILLLAERLASTGALDLIILLDLSIVYASHPTRLRALFSNALSTSSSPGSLSSATDSVLPAFTSVLVHTNTGLHGLRKAAHTILRLLRVAPRDLLRTFAHSRDLMLSLAQAYDAGLGAAASSYGRLYLPTARSTAPLRAPDDWEVLFLYTKADLLDAFHILITTLLDDLAALSPGPPLATETARTSEILSAIHALPAPTRTNDSPPPTAFLNRSLLADYQHAYRLSEMLSRALRNRGAADDNAHLERLSVALCELDADLDDRCSGADPAGAFTLLLGSSVQHGQGTDHLGSGARIADERATPSRDAAETIASSSRAGSNRAVDPRVEEVRAIFPDYAPEYVEALLLRTEYATVERVVEALLEGTAPPLEAVQQQIASKPQTPRPRDEFDGEAMDISRLRMGKKSDDAMTVLRDRSFIEQMKADILRRVEEPSDSEAEEINIFGAASKNKGKVRVVAFDDDLDDVGSVRIAGDGEESSEDDSAEEEEGPQTDPQTILELAYIANPKVFERDAATRRGKERAALRAQTGWVDEQIEGFKIMLERDPKTKESMLEKHEFSGNKPLAGSSGPNSRSRTPDIQSARDRGGGGRGGRGRGQSRGRGRGRGRGTGEGASAGAGDSGANSNGGDARNHAWKNKSKARQANHDRKRGHDKKMSKAGGPTS